MARAFSPEDLASRTFMITMVGVGAFIAVVFLFIL
jgi:hypothetical protein